MICDFHLHSRASDGALEPGELVDLAARCGVEALALTDHDGVAGLGEARARANQLGLAFVSGVEISVAERGGQVLMHVLGLGFDDAHPELLQALERLRQAREMRAGRILEKLRACGVELDPDLLRADRGDVIGRPHIARALVASGTCRSVDEGFRQYIGRGQPAYEPSPGVSAREAIDVIHAAGGVASLAHPPRSLGADGPGGLEAFVERLVRLGLDGVEVQHPSHKRPQRKRLRRIARAHGLIQTGGSDFHQEGRGIVPGRGRGDIEVGEDVYRAITRS